MMTKMPECENPYKSHSRLDSLITKEKVWDEGFEKGQQNPDPKQYAKREELVEEIKMCSQTVEEIMEDYETEQVEAITRDAVLEIVRTHGLEE